VAELKKLRVVNFRNIKKQEIEFKGKNICFWGNNAQGKTNLLESIYLMANLRSFRNGLPEDWINMAEQATSVYGDFTNNQSGFDIKILLDKTKKEYFLNEKKTKSLKDIMENLRIIAYSPTSYEIITGSESFRRSFFDKVCFALDPSYLTDLVYYNKTLLNRNTALKNKKNFTLWDDVIAKVTVKISEKRKLAGSQIETYVKQLFSVFFEDVQDIEIKYKNNTGFSYKEVMENLEKSSKKDISYGYTNVGSHRDVYEIKLKGTNAKKIVSTGQAKLLSFLLKLAKSRLIKKEGNVNPIFLFDDVNAFLDIDRFKKLIEMLAQEQMQVFFTSVDKNILKNYAEDIQLINVEDGVAHYDR